jgi:hypothetical protein
MSKQKMIDVEIDLDDATFLVLAKEAHRQDITFNQLANKILVEQMKREEEEKSASRKQNRVQKKK